MEFLNSLIKIFFDKSENFYSKAITILLIILLLVFIDNTLNFVYFQTVSKKVNYVNIIGDTIEDETLSEKEKSQLFEIRKEILSKPSYKSLGHAIFYQLTNISIKQGDSRNFIIHFLSSTWWLLLLIAIMIVLIPISLKFEKNQPIIVVIGAVCVIIVALGGAFLLSKLFFLIPQILETPFYNYMLNFILSSILAYFIFKTMQRRNSRTLNPK